LFALLWIVLLFLPPFLSALMDCNVTRPTVVLHCVNCTVVQLYTASPSRKCAK